MNPPIRSPLRRPSVTLLMLLLLGLAPLPSQTRGLHPYHLLSLDGAQKHDVFGFSLDALGDVDRDGHPDFVVGAYRGDTKNGVDTGLVHIVSGRTGKVVRTLNGRRPGDMFGLSVRAAGDCNRDGWPDLIVGAPGDDASASDAGSATLFSGRDGSVLWSTQGRSAGDQLGNSVSGAGDVDRDGWPDVVVGTVGDDRQATNAGSATIWSGRTGQPLHVFFGDAALDQLGVSVRGVGDMDGDGHADVIAGAWKNDQKGRDVGMARVYSGKTGAVLHTVFGEKVDDLFGNSVAGAGDVDRDGVPDFVVGAYAAARPLRHMGAALVFSGKTGKVLHRWQGDGWGDFFGIAVSGAGDVDRDGHEDVAVGAIGDDDGGRDAGSVKVFSGRTGALLRRFDGRAGDELGVALAAGGDLNRDDWGDLLVGAQQQALKLEGAGQVHALTLHGQYLRSDICCVSLAAVGAQRLTLQAGDSFANRIFLVLGSASGTSPGIRVGSITIPLNRDAYHLVLLANPNSLVLGSVGLLDRSGNGSALVQLPPGLDPGLKGLRLHHAYVVLDLRPTLLFASNAVPVELR